MTGVFASRAAPYLLGVLPLGLLTLALSCGCSTGNGPPSTSGSSTSPSSTPGSASPQTSSGAERQTERPQAPQRFEDCPEDLDALVGRRITLVGTQTRSKIPTVCGVDVDGDYQLSDEAVEVTGRLERHVIEPRPPDAPPVASRGPGTYYRLVDPDTGQLAATRPH